ncbi:hypothetical protein AAFF_G00213060 [Aldrovandia affinis]|uniref:Uncharacterized protein n=1 Tax=Aldrovandia affinis TaxID=143900 RepID=A0AAD7W4Y5_9TELE|nr:hypothetical protein AAFF_G00213060 [Aldrovandia affinis]
MIEKERKGRRSGGRGANRNEGVGSRGDRTHQTAERLSHYQGVRTWAARAKDELEADKGPLTSPRRRRDPEPAQRSSEADVGICQTARKRHPRRSKRRVKGTAP